jgi:hypothetical protein
MSAIRPAFVCGARTRGLLFAVAALFAIGAATATSTIKDTPRPTASSTCSDHYPATIAIGHAAPERRFTRQVTLKRATLVQRRKRARARPRMRTTTECGGCDADGRQLVAAASAPVACRRPRGGCANLGTRMGPAGNQ